MMSTDLNKSKTLRRETNQALQKKTIRTISRKGQQIRTQDEPRWIVARGLLNRIPEPSCRLQAESEASEESPQQADEYIENASCEFRSTEQGGR